MYLQSEDIKRDIRKWWNTYVFRTGLSRDFTEEEFLQDLTEKWTADKAAFKLEMHECFTLIFQTMNTNHDAFIQLNEFLYFYKAFGHTDTAAVTKAFHMYKTPNGIPINDIIQSWADFVSNDDRNQPDIVNETIKECL